MTQHTNLADTQASFLEQAQKANGSRRVRTVGYAEFNQAVQYADNNVGALVRVYSLEGFVANSYRSAAPISYIELRRTETGYEVNVSVTDAKRTNGKGSQVTIDGRAI